MNLSDSALYVGQVTHRRLRPRKHALAYRTFALLLDLDKLPDLAARLRLLSHNSFNLFSFYDRDYGWGAAPLREQIEGHARRVGIDLDGAIKIRKRAVAPSLMRPDSLATRHGRRTLPSASATARPACRPSS